MPQTDSLLLDNEKIVFSTRKHLIIFFIPLIWTGIAALLFWVPTPFTYSTNELPLLRFVADLVWIPVIIALLSWFNQGLIYSTSIFLVTNRRVIMREGFFFRHATETNLSAIAEIKIDQSLIGRFLNFGNITINSFGGGAEVFSSISAPYTFQKQAAEMRTQLSG